MFVYLHIFNLVRELIYAVLACTMGALKATKYTPAMHPNHRLLTKGQKFQINFIKP